MNNLESWAMQIRGCVSDLRAESTLGIGDVADPPLYRELALSGFSGVMPLWSGRRHVVGLLVDPFVEPQSWPAVMLDDGDALTLATDSRTLLPQLVVKRVLSKFPQSAQKLAARWHQVEAAAMALHRALGGADDSLQEVVNVASDPRKRDAFGFTSGQEAAFEEAHSALCRSIDRSEPFTRFAAWMDAAVAGRATAPELPAHYGAWGRRVIMSAQRMAVARPDMPRPATASLQLIIEEFAGVDSAVAARPSWSAQAGAASGESALVEAAMSIDREAPSQEDPIARGIVQALLAEGTSYSGLAHSEATVLLDERGHSARAWAVLQSASWWSARSLGKTPEAMLTGAQFMAARHGWADAGWVIDRATRAV